MIDSNKIKSNDITGTGYEESEGMENDKMYKKNSPVDDSTNFNFDKKDLEGNVEISNSEKMTPTDLAKIRSFNANTKKELNKANFFSFLKYIISIFLTLIGILITFLAVLWAYKINNIAEPIGSIKESIKHIGEDNEKINRRLDKIDDKIYDDLKNSQVEIEKK